MLDFSRFSLSNMVESGTVLRSVGDGAGTMEEVAGRIVNAIDNWFRIPGTGEPACVLVRLFKTHPYRDLPVELETIAREQMAPGLPSPGTRCLTLLGTTGLLPEWRTPARSERHRVISLPSVEAMARFPMINQLVRQLGLEVGSMLHPSPTFLVDSEQRAFNVFHVPEAAGSPDIPDQAGFVVPHGVRSVLGFGGMLPGGELFAVILFSRVPIPRGTAELFRPLALCVKIALLPFVNGPVFAATARRHRTGRRRGQDPGFTDRGAGATAGSRRADDPAAVHRARRSPGRGAEPARIGGRRHRDRRRRRAHRPAEPGGRADVRLRPRRADRETGGGAGPRAAACPP